MKRIEAVIKGLTPLLQNAFGDTGETDLPGSKGGSKTRPIHVAEEADPRDVAAKAAYRNRRGEFFFPSTAILRLCRETAGRHKIKGSRRSLKYEVPAAVFLVGDEVVITNGDGKTPVRDFEVDSRPVVIPATKGRIMRHRPRWDQWSATVVLDVDEEMLATAFVHQLLTEGGRRCGIGDFRPEKGGPFGRFRVMSFRELDGEGKRKRGRPRKV